MGISSLQLSIGDRAPDILGATASGRFYSLDSQAGRPALIVALGALEAGVAGALFERLCRLQSQLAETGVDLVPLAPMLQPFTERFSTDPAAYDLLVYTSGNEGLESLDIEGRAAAVLIDRGARIVGLSGLDAETDLIGWLGASARQIASAAPRICTATAPVLMIPNIMPPALCQALIAHFEASPHAAGVMASFSDGAAYAKLDESKKKRRDTELTAESPLHGEVVHLLASRVIPAIKTAFQADIANADRILIARYDDTGGYFKRHRDNTAPHTAFREFAISLNLNTDDYEGGELKFPEYDDHRYNPPAGGAIVFSASLLHEAAPVTKGSRYVLLSFLGSAEAQARLTAWVDSQQAIAS
ncbi:2OG-Fe(II) oxygenase family protein [Phenylobacterium sp.]|uniref:2OG-Fe(II) oxygenase family protein n=1 Tax=Phenylobacterium sp. TaxID=1871053 RepID=UPI00374CAF9B